jgi:hypothetical protein
MKSVDKMWISTMPAVDNPLKTVDKCPISVEKPVEIGVFGHSG